MATPGFLENALQGSLAGSALSRRRRRREQQAASGQPANTPSSGGATGATTVNVPVPPAAPPVASATPAPPSTPAAPADHPNKAAFDELMKIWIELRRVYENHQFPGTPVGTNADGSTQYDDHYDEFDELTTRATLLGFNTVMRTAGIPVPDRLMQRLLGLTTTPVPPPPATARTRPSGVPASNVVPPPSPGDSGAASPTSPAPGDGSFSTKPPAMERFRARLRASRDDALE
jgi:hypothetical protein